MPPPHSPSTSRSSGATFRSTLRAIDLVRLALRRKPLLAEASLLGGLTLLLVYCFGKGIHLGYPGPFFWGGAAFVSFGVAAQLLMSRRVRIRFLLPCALLPVRLLDQNVWMFLLATAATVGVWLTVRSLPCSVLQGHSSCSQETGRPARKGWCRHLAPGLRAAGGAMLFQLGVEIALGYMPSMDEWLLLTIVRASLASLLVGISAGLIQWCSNRRIWHRVVGTAVVLLLAYLLTRISDLAWHGYGDPIGDLLRGSLLPVALISVSLAPTRPLFAATAGVVMWACSHYHYRGVYSHLETAVSPLLGLLAGMLCSGRRTFPNLHVGFIVYAAGLCAVLVGALLGEALLVGWYWSGIPSYITETARLTAFCVAGTLAVVVFMSGLDRIGGVRET